MKFLKAQCDSTTTQTLTHTCLSSEASLQRSLRSTIAISTDQDVRLLQELNGGKLNEVDRGCFSISSIKEMLFSVLSYNNDSMCLSGS